MKKHHIDRLEKLHTFLGTVKPQRFYFGTWGESGSGKPDLNVCGSTACALGWAGSMPEFRKRGLRLEWEVTEYGPDDAEADAFVRLYGKDGFYLSDIEAGAEFFGLTNEESQYLFIPKGHGLFASIGPMDMSLQEYRKGLRRFIDKKKRELKVA